MASSCSLDHQLCLPILLYYSHVLDEAVGLNVIELRSNNNQFKLGSYLDGSGRSICNPGGTQ